MNDDCLFVTIFKREIKAFRLALFRDAIVREFPNLLVGPDMLRLERQKRYVWPVASWARLQKRDWCCATSSRWIEEKEDVDDCFRYHLAWELDIVADQRKPPSTRKRKMT